MKHVLDMEETVFGLRWSRRDSRQPDDPYLNGIHAALRWVLDPEDITPAELLTGENGVLDT